MQSRIDTNPGTQGEPDAWVHSACILGRQQLETSWHDADGPPHERRATAAGELGARLEIALGDLLEITSPNGRWEGVARHMDKPV